VRTGRVRHAWVTAAPLAFLLVVTFTAGLQLIASSDPSVGFLARARASGNPAEIFNARLDAVVAGVFLVLVATVVLSAARQAWGVVSGRIALEREAFPGGGPGRPAFGEVPPIGGSTRCC